MILNAEYSGIHPLAKAFLYSADWHLLCGNFSIFHELGLGSRNLFRRMAVAFRPIIFRRAEVN